MTRILLTFFAFALFVTGSAARASDDDTIMYQLKQGDTLIGIAKKYMARESDYLKRTPHPKNLTPQEPTN